MKQISPEIVFFGTDNFSLTALTALIETGYPIAAVVTKPDTRSGRGQKLTPSVIKILATENNIPVWQPDKISEIATDIESLGRPIGVLSSYGKIIPQKIIDLFSPGIINIHPSLLPRYRGPTPIETAIANGDDKTGVSIMHLAAGLDDGPVYVVKEHRLTGKETSAELYHALADIGANLLLETLPLITSGSLLPTPQDEKHASYTHLLAKEDAWLDIKNISAVEAERRVRAYSIFPKTKITIDGHTLIVTKASVSEMQTDQLDLICSDGQYLSIDELIAPSGRHMSAAEFGRGYLRGA